MELSSIYTVKSAQFVANAIAHFIHREGDYFKLEIVKHSDTEAVPMEPLWVRLSTTAKVKIITLENGAEIAQCETKDKKEISIIVGIPEERIYRPAIVIFDITKYPEIAKLAG